MLFREAAQLWSTCETARLASEDTLRATALSSASVASDEGACDAPLCSEGVVPAQHRDEGTQPTPDLGSFPRHGVLQQAKEAREPTVCVELPLQQQQQQQQEDRQEHEQGQDQDACGDSDSQCSLELPGLPSTQSKRTHRSLDFKQ